MRLAVISTIFGHPWGGADTLWTAAAATALARNDSVLLSLSADTAAAAQVEQLVQLGARIHIRQPAPDHYPLMQRAMVKFGLKSAPEPELLANLRAFRPDLVLISQGGTYDLLSYPLLCQWLARESVPYRLIANLQSAWPVLSAAERDQAGVILAQADGVNFVSEANLAATRRHLLHSLPNARVVQNPIRLPAASAPLPWPSGPDWRLATLSRLHPIKGIDLLIHTLAASFTAPAEWRLDIYGAGAERDHLQAIIRHHRLDARVTLCGYANDLDAVWSHHHLLISPAFDEGVPMTIPEAMLRGRPVLATAVGAATEWISPGSDGFICPAPTLDLLGQTLREAWARRHDWPAMGKAAHTSASARYRADDHLAIIS
jgi:glycosyltransferase involved in cell wall biosynthesis